MSELRPPHVVVLDGSPLYAEIYGNLLASAHYRVTQLTDCAVAPETVLDIAPDLIIVDLRCGAGMRGLDFVRRLRQEPVGADVPVIASTPASLIDLERFGPELNALGADVLTDEFDFLDRLLAAARAALAQSRDVRSQSKAAVKLLRDSKLPKNKQR